MLDFGCGDGSFLAFAQDHTRGETFLGFEIGAPRDACDPKEEGSFRIHTAPTEDDFTLPPSTLDLVTMNHVIEHLARPLETLTNVGAAMKVGAILEGQTPAAASLEQRVFGTRWSGYHSPRHTVVFSPQGLKGLLESTGFENISIKAAFNPASLAISLMSLINPRSGGRIRRGGALWLTALAGALALAPIDLLSGRAAVVNFRATKK